tara:strand:- start:1250 stop:1426 length:177 start_codon:yes stop_codon:yes gene_type:complete
MHLPKERQGFMEYLYLIIIFICVPLLTWITISSTAEDNEQMQDKWHDNNENKTIYKDL